jgi:hypothetical protein
MVVGCSANKVNFLLVEEYVELLCDINRKQHAVRSMLFFISFPVIQHI